MMAAEYDCRAHTCDAGDAVVGIGADRGERIRINGSAPAGEEDTRKKQRLRTKPINRLNVPVDWKLQNSQPSFSLRMCTKSTEFQLNFITLFIFC